MSLQTGALIKKARTSAGMTQADLAKAVEGISASDISKAERGILDLTPDQLTAIAGAVGVAPEALMNIEANASSAGEVPSTPEMDASMEEGDAPALLTETEKELLALYRRSGSGIQNAVRFVLRGEKQLLPKLMSMLPGIIKSLGENGGEKASAKEAGGGENGNTPVVGMLSNVISMMGELISRKSSGENQDKPDRPSKPVSGSFLLFTFFYSVSIYILLLSFYFWQVRTDIRPEKQGEADIDPCQRNKEE